jgi:putative SOS response-associated peptidase YedK
MCNLYSLTKGQAAIRDWFRTSNNRTGNLPLFPGIFPDQMAPIVRNGADGERELVMARWSDSPQPAIVSARLCFDVNDAALRRRIGRVAAFMAR